VTRTRVYIDQDLCTGDGLCEEIAPAVFMSHDDGLYYVKNWDDSDDGRDANGAPKLKGASGLAYFTDDLADAVAEAAENCPGACIYIEQDDGTYRAE
jgi:ferredoxin